MRVHAVAILAALAAALVLGSAALRNPAAPPADPEAARLARLHALGYVDWVDVDPGQARRRGVTHFVPGRAQAGSNFFHSRTQNLARLVDMNGRVLHVWRAGDPRDRWHHAEPAAGGDLLVIVNGRSLLRLDWSSTVLWTLELVAHHDIALDAAGRIHTLSSERVDFPFRSGRVPVVDEFVAVISPDGRLLRRVSLLALFGDRIPPARLEAIRDRTRGLGPRLRDLLGWRDADVEQGEVLHANSVEILDRDVPGLGSRGNALISLRELDLIAVVDLDTERVVWSWGEGQLEAQHQPSLLDDGNLLVFDNGTRRGYSRVIEVEPASGRIVWEFSGNPQRSLRSRRKGGCQKLPNGNVLITESEKGRAFEVTRRGETVWSFLNPDLDADQARRRPIYRMTRFDTRGACAVASSHTSSTSSPLFTMPCSE